MSPIRESRDTRGTTPRSTLLGAVVGDAHLKDTFPKPLRTIAGVCVAANTRTGRLQGAAVLMSFDTLEVLEVSTADVSLEEPAADTTVLRTAMSDWPVLPDLVLVAGHGVSDATRAGLAVRLGVLMDLPTIGVALEADVGTSKPLHAMRGAFAPLREAGVQIGWILRSKIDDAPLIVSPGHRVSMAAAPELVLEVVRTARLPEPIRIAESHLPQD